MRKQITIILIIIMLMLGSCSIMSKETADEPDYSVPQYLEYSSKVYWTFSNKILLIDGAGPIYGGCGAQALNFRYTTARDTARELSVQGEISYISAYAFSRFEGLKSAVITAPVSEMGMGVFAFSDSLKEVDFGATRLSRITLETFWGCKNLRTIVLPASITVIATDAFDGCSKLKTVYYKGTQEQWHAIRIESGNDPLSKATIIFLKEESTL